MPENLMSRKTHLATAHQLAFAIFEDLWPVGDKVADSPQDIGFQRSNVFIDITDLGLVARRALDVAYFIVSQDPEIRRIYDVELNFFQWLMTYGSNNRKHFRAVLREAQKAALQADVFGSMNPNEDKWGSIPLLGPVGIAGGRIVFEVHETLQRHIKDPAASHFFSLCCNGFTTLYGRVVFEHILPYGQGGVTEWLDIDTVRAWPGTAAKSHAEFRYFKRDALDPALKQINELTHLAVRYETRSGQGTKKISKIRFVITLKDEPKTLQSAMLGSKELYLTLQNEFGLSPTNFDEIMQNRPDWSDERIHLAMDFTRWSVSKGKVTKSVSGFLMKALRDALRVPQLARVIEEQAADQKAKAQQAGIENETRKAGQKEADDAAAQRIAGDATAGLAGFALLTDNERLEIVSKFVLTVPARGAAKSLGVDAASLTETVILQNKRLSDVFGVFMQQQLAKKRAEMPA